MDLLNKFRKRLPGSPESVAKTMLKAFRNYQHMNPGSLREEALRYAIESRYKIIKVVSQDKIEWIMERSDCLETMVFLSFCEENNLIKYVYEDENHPLIETVSNDISDFFKNNAPEESYFGSNH